MDEKKIREFALKIGESLAHLHNLGIVLRNFSANGILMTDAEQDHYSVLSPSIAHLDKAVILPPDRQTSGLFGDVRYRAPEVVKGQPYEQMADCWTYGVILFYMLTGELPFNSEKLPKHKDVIIEAECEESPEIRKVRNNLKYPNMKEE